MLAERVTGAQKPLQAQLGLDEQTAEAEGEAIAADPTSASAANTPSDSTSAAENTASMEPQA